jgi:hypothetical protein
MISVGKKEVGTQKLKSMYLSILIQKMGKTLFGNEHFWFDQQMNKGYYK